ncbi:mycofactocin precursor MftA [Streptomyces melanosporofaciens]|uniref:Mycofactocin n=1 Tax=Streptomyces melanosporofaciens TaxID=67327 RepID=A0A1H4I8C6_STRMJ|nr:mycofactocin precursor MftA [Streptomyces melanosporofaciens]SEB30354.1 mycofactocin precursor [Streptomyces melanosporofaciens]
MRTPEHIAAEVAAEAAGDNRSDPRPDQGPDGREPVEELLVEEVSIDGMCGVY